LEDHTDFYHGKDSLTNLTAKAKQSISHARIASEFNYSIANRSTLSNPESSTVQPPHFSISSPFPTLIHPQRCLSVLPKPLFLGGNLAGPVVLSPLFGAAGAGAFGGGAKTGAGVTGAGEELGAGVVLPFPPPPPPPPPLSLFAQTRPSANPYEIATARYSRPRQG